MLAEEKPRYLLTVLYIDFLLLKRGNPQRIITKAGVNQTFLLAH